MAIETDRKAREARAQRYGISIREDGHVTKPGEYQDVSDADFADPVNYAYPMDTPERARAAVRYWGKRRNQGQDSDSDQAAIQKRMVALCEKQGITANFAIDGRIELGESIEVEEAAAQKLPIQMAEFPLSPIVQFDGEMVVLAGKLFEAGEYPDKGISVTEEELASAASSFSPVENRLEHRPTILDGKLGRLERVVARGKELFGTIRIPRWLHDAIGKAPIKTSLEWSRNTKQIVGNGLVLAPRIPDAELVAAFNNAATSQEAGATGPAKRGDTMTNTWWEKLKSLFAAKQLPEGFEDFDPEKVHFAEEHPPKGAEPTQKPEGDEAAKFAAIEKLNAGLAARLIQTEAERFYAAAVAEHKVFPAERDALIAQFRLAVQDDAAGKACFAEDGTLNEGERVKVLKALIAARPAHRLTEEQVGNLDLKDLVLLSANAGSGNGKDKMTEERKKELLDAGEIHVPAKEVK